MPGETFEWTTTTETPRPGGVTEIVRFTRDRITVSYRDPELRLTPELTKKLQDFWSKRIEEMAYTVLTGGRAPEREQSTLDVRKYREMFPNGRRRGRYGAIIDLDAVVT